MLASRLLVTIVLLPVGMWLIVTGGWAFTLAIALLAGVAAWEIAHMLQQAGLRPTQWGMPLGAALIVLARGAGGMEASAWALSLVLLASMTYHLIDYERGRDQAASDFAVSVMGMVYCGWIGAYLVSLRGLPEGKWWILLALPAVWIADSGAYAIGKGFGRHPLSPRLSPKKTWEGYWAGVVSGALAGWFFSVLWIIGAGAGTSLAPWKGAVLGLILSALTPLGDLGESMIKRQVGVKDSSNIIPGHGGVFDRIDSWLWAGVLGYYLVLWWLG